MTPFWVSGMAKVAWVLAANLPILNFNWEESMFWIREMGISGMLTNAGVWVVFITILNAAMRRLLSLRFTTPTDPMEFNMRDAMVSMPSSSQPVDPVTTP